MNIRIHRLTLQNFKGLRNADFLFEGRNATIEGENGAGKSTIFDAFTWLLFGKDHQGQDWTNFDLKPIDPETGAPIHRLEHSVEAVLDIDGAKTTLRRVVTENWVKPKGESTPVMKGHTQQFFVDGVDTGTKNAYDTIIRQWIDENVFKMLTNPLYFIDDQYTDWKSRRKAILSLVGESGQTELREQFADLLAEMAGEPLEQFKKRVAQLKKANRDDLAAATAAIAAYKKTLPDVVDKKTLEAQIAKIISERDQKIANVQEKISAIDAKISDINTANEGKKAAIDNIWSQIYVLRNKMNECISEARCAAQKRNTEHRNKLQDVNFNLDEIKRILQENKVSIDKRSQSVEDMRRDRAAKVAELEAVGAEYKQEREKAFDPDSVGVCPTCGQPLPEEALQAKAAEFAEKRKSALLAIVDRASRLKEEISHIDNGVAAYLGEIESLSKEAAGLEQKKTMLEKAIADMEEVPFEDLKIIEDDVRRSPEFLDMVKKELDLQGEARDAQREAVSPRDLVQERKAAEAEIVTIRREYDARLRPIQDGLAVHGERERILGLIAEAEKRETEFADEVARLERLEFRASEYMKATIDAQEGAINALFHVARWKMFDRTIDGGIVEMCEVTSETGVPYRSMNDAKKILCGLDVIRAFGSHYECVAPIFIDNAESITQKTFDTEAQVIRLVVKEGAALTMYNN